MWGTGLSYSRGPFVGTTGAIGSTAFDRIEILGCGNKLIEIFRPLSQRTACAPLRYPRAGKVLPSQEGVHCRQKFPIRIWLENVPFRSVA